MIPALRTTKPIDATIFAGNERALVDELVSANGGRPLTLADLDGAFRAAKNDPERGAMLRAMLKRASAPEGVKRSAQVQAEQADAAKAVARAAENEPIEIQRFRERLGQRLIGQPAAKDAAARFVRAAMQNLSDKPRIVLEPGPPGVGKTTMSTALAYALHGDPDKHVFIDCATLTDKTTLHKYFGVANGFVGYEARSTSALAPSTVAQKFGDKRPIIVHIDEPDKMGTDAARDFWAKMNRFFETGWLELDNGERTDLRGCIVVIATNAGSSDPKAASLRGEQLDEHYRQAAEAALAAHTNSRINAIVPFRNLELEDSIQIAQLKLRDMFGAAVRKMQREQGKVVSIEATDAVAKLLGELGLNPLLGARPLATIVDDLIMPYVAELIAKAEDESKFKLAVRPDFSDHEKAQLLDRFQKLSGKVPNTVNAYDLVNLELVNPPPQIFEYQGGAKIPQGEYGAIRAMGAGMAAGRSFMVVNRGDIDSENEIALLRLGATEAADQYDMVKLPAELAECNVRVQAVTIDEPAHVIDPDKRNNRVFLLGTHVDPETDEARTVAYVWDRTNRASPFTKVDASLPPLEGAALSSVDGQVVLWGGRLIEKDETGNWTVDQREANRVGAAIENQAWVLDATKPADALAFEPIDSMASAARTGAAVARYEGKLVFAGGTEIRRTASGAPYAVTSTKVDAYDPTTRTFASMPWELPTGVTNASLRTDDFHRLQLSGGLELTDNGMGEPLLRSINLRIDPALADPQWKRRTDLQTPGADVVAMPTPRGTVMGPFFAVDDATGEVAAKWYIERPPETK